jgi:hypothetical protein
VFWPEVLPYKTYICIDVNSKKVKLILCLISFQALGHEDMDVSGQLHAPAALSPEKEPLLPVPLDKRLGGHQGWIWILWRRENHEWPGIKPGASSL